MKNAKVKEKLMSLYCDIWANKEFAKALEYSEQIEELDGKLSETDICYKKRMRDVLKKMPTANKFIMMERTALEKLVSELPNDDTLDIVAEFSSMKNELLNADILYLNAARDFIADYRYKLHNLGKKHMATVVTCVKFSKLGYKAHGHGPIRDTYNH